MRCLLSPAVLATWAQFSQGHFAGVSAWTAGKAPLGPAQQQRSLYFLAPCGSLLKPFYIGTLSWSASVHCPLRYGIVWK